jgi:hypothetical protein
MNFNPMVSQEWGFLPMRYYTVEAMTRLRGILRRELLREVRRAVPGRYMDSVRVHVFTETGYGMPYQWMVAHYCPTYRVGPRVEWDPRVDSLSRYLSKCRDVKRFARL